MAPAPVLQVFGQPASTNVARVMACLFERNLHFELVRTDAVNRAHNLPAAGSGKIIRQDPNRGLVTLKHGGATLTDSREICRYVCTEFPRECNTRALYGAGSLERASIEKWLCAEARSFDAPSTELASHYLALALAPPPPAERVVDVTAENERRLLRVLGVYDDALARTRYLAGDEFTLADLSHLPNAHRVAGHERGRMLLGSMKHVARWYEDVAARPSWRRVVAAAQSAHPEATGAACGRVRAVTVLQGPSESVREPRAMMESVCNCTMTCCCV